MSASPMLRRVLLPQQALPDTVAIGRIASECLKLEVNTYPKPGLVSHIDSGSHHDMDAAMLERSADTLAPYFAALAQAGARGADMSRLRIIGIGAEQAMLAATGGINTHRGAIFGLGLLCAAAGLRDAGHLGGTLGGIVRMRWAPGIHAGPVTLRTHGAQVARRHGAGGARMEAAQGFPSLYGYALPALEHARTLAPHDPEAVRVHVCISLIASVQDTNLLYRGGAAGLAFAQDHARHFLAWGGIASADWRQLASRMHEAFVARRLSPGGCADLLAMSLFVERMGG